MRSVRPRRGRLQVTAIVMARRTRWRSASWASRSAAASGCRTALDRRVCRQGAKAATQALLRLVGHRDRPARLAVAATGQGVANARRVLIMPGRFHQDAPHQRVAGARDGAPSMFLAAGMFAGHEPDVRHQRARRAKPPEVVQFAEQQHRRQGIDAPKTAQPAHGVAVRVSAARSPPGGYPIPAAVPPSDRSLRGNRRPPRARRRICRLHRVACGRSASEAAPPEALAALGHHYYHPAHGRGSTYDCVLTVFKDSRSW